MVWRFVVDRAQTEEGEDRALLIGYNLYQEPITQWEYRTLGPSLHSVDRIVPESVAIPPVEVELREDPIAIPDPQVRDLK